MKQVLILDTETTALSPADGQCIEVGAILFDLELKSVVAQLSFLMPCIVNQAEAINRIPAALTTSQPSQVTDAAMGAFHALVAAADAFVAHNAEFDQQWFDGAWLPVLPEGKPWICTMADVSWPKELGLKGRPSVISLALAHGVPVWAAHRALTDCIYLAQVFERVDNPQALLAAALEPKAVYRALVSYDDRELAKEAGFAWDAQRRVWIKKMAQSEADRLRSQFESGESRLRIQAL